MRNLKTMTRDDWRGVRKVLAEARYLQRARFSENANTAGELPSLYEHGVMDAVNELLRQRSPLAEKRPLHRSTGAKTYRALS